MPSRRRPDGIAVDDNQLTQLGKAALLDHLIAAALQGDPVDRSQYPAATSGGSIYGVHEDQLLDTGVTYILVGERAVHGQEAIMNRPHDTL